MDILVLDGLLRPVQLVDNYNSLVWTERFKAAGDFELELESTRENRSLFQPGAMLGMSKSHRIMMVETVEESLNSDGAYILKCKGESLEAILKYRVAREVFSKDDETTYWTFDGVKPADILRYIFKRVCLDGALNPLDVLPSVVEQSIMPPSTNPEPPDKISIKLELMTVYDALTKLCDIWGLGFRLLTDRSTSTLYWDVYAGSDRTSTQNVLDPVLFTPELDNLTNITELNSIGSMRNVAYVFTPDNWAMTYPEAIPETPSGFDRRVLLVKASDIRDGTSPEPKLVLIQAGREELAQNRITKAFDGEIDPDSYYQYQTHYYLGDLIELRNSDGVANHMRVTEFIFTCDESGERSYPTLELHQFLEPGSWASWGAHKTWMDLDADPVSWSSLP